MTPQLLVNDRVLQISPKVMMFDKDGTIIDIHHYWSSMIRMRAEKIVQKYFLRSEDRLSIKNSLMDLMGVNLHTGRIKSEGPVGIKPRNFIVDLVSQKVRNFGIDVINNEIESLFVDVDQMTDNDMLPFLRLLPGVEKLLINLHKCGIQSIIVSTDTTSRALKAMEALQLDRYFVEIIGADQVDRTKPAPDLANLALQRLNCVASEAVVIGDHLVDIQMGIASNVGVNIGVLTGLSSISTFETHECEVISDLTNLKISCQ